MVVKHWIMYAGEKKKNKPKTKFIKFQFIQHHNHCSVSIDQKLNHTAQVYIIIEGCCDLILLKNPNKSMDSKIVKGVLKWWTNLKMVRDDYRNWENLTPRRKIDCFLNFGNCVCKLVGLNVLDKCQLNLYAYFPVAVIAIYFILAVYTVVKNTLTGNFFEGIKSFSISGWYISVSLQKNNVTNNVFRTQFKIWFL